MCFKATAVLLLLCAQSIRSKEDKDKNWLPQFEGLLETLPSLAQLLFSDSFFSMDMEQNFGPEADGWVDESLPEIRQLFQTLDIFVRMAFKAADKSSKRKQLEKVEVDTFELIFKGIIKTIEELVDKVLPMVDFLPNAAQKLINKESLLGLVKNLVGSELFNMDEQTVNILVKGLKSVSDTRREDGLNMLKIVIKMLKMSESDDDSEGFDDLFLQLLMIVPRELQRLQEDYTQTVNSLKTNKVVINGKPLHHEL